MDGKHELHLATKVLTLAVAILALVIVAALAVDGGVVALSAMGGAYVGPAPETAIRVALAIDFLFPVAFGSGLMLLVIGLGRHGRSEGAGLPPAAILALVCLTIGVLADFTENGFAVAALRGNLHAVDALGAASIFKYGIIAVAGPLTSSLIAGHDGVARLVVLALRYLLPLALGLIVSNLVPTFTQTAPLTFMLFLGLLALFARRVVNG
ncbi:MAG: hypothetical protein Q8Q26_17980 [Pseudorhodobacter sp.]|nr:hypothetical protein [Pseudorhodobacter sp.]